MEQKRHFYYFDYLRIFAAFCVIFMHTAADPLRGELNGQWEVLNVLTSLAFTAVPLFFMMSGYLLLSGERTKDVSLLLKKRLPKLILPLMVWSLIYILWDLYQQGGLTLRAIVTRGVQALQEPAAVHLWFLYTLIALYLVSPLLYGAVHGLTRSGHRLVLFLMGAVTVQAMILPLLPASWEKLVTWDLFSKLQIFGGHLCAFLLGYYMGSLKRKIPNSLLLGLAALLLTVIVLGTRVLTRRSGIYTPTFQQQHQGYEVALAACLFLLAKQNLDKVTKLILPKSELLLAVYLVHNLLLSILISRGIVARGLWDTLLLTLGNYAVSYYLVKTLTSVKPLSYLFTGIPYKTACKTCNWINTFRK